MNRKIVGILVTTLLISAALPAVGTMNVKLSEKPLATSDIDWEVTIDRGEYDSIRHIEQTDDDGYICCGLTEESDMFYVQVLKLDSTGGIDWHIVNYNLNASVVTVQDSWVFGMYYGEKVLVCLFSYGVSM